jgi:prepilin peptidase CpaA
MQQVLLWSVLIIAAITDLWRGLIYNWLTLSAIVAGIIFAAIAGGWYSFSLSLAGTLIGGAVFLPGFYTGQVGGGDVKLMAAVGAITGPVFLVQTMVASILVGGLIALTIILLRGEFIQTIILYFRTIKIFILRRLYKGSAFAYPGKNTGSTFPFAVSILAGAFIASRVDMIAIFLK